MDHTEYLVKLNFGGSWEKYWEAQEIYSEGLTLVINQEYLKAKPYLEKASEMGYGKASLHLSRLWKWGSFGRRDLEEAIGYAELAIMRHEMYAKEWREKLKRYEKFGL